jgi:hypothetical protein
LDEIGEATTPGLLGRNDAQTGNMFSMTEISFQLEKSIRSNLSKSSYSGCEDDNGTMINIDDGRPRPTTSLAACQQEFQIGERVKCSDGGLYWLDGTVVSLSPLKVQTRGSEVIAAWKKVQRKEEA